MNLLETLTREITRQTAALELIAEKLPNMRELAAMLSSVGLLADGPRGDDEVELRNAVTTTAREYADALLAELETNQNA